MSHQSKGKENRYLCMTEGERHRMQIEYVVLKQRSKEGCWRQECNEWIVGVARAGSHKEIRDDKGS